MKSVKIWMAFLVVLVLHGAASATQITGKISEVAGDTVTVVLDQAMKPAVGDTAQVYIMLAGDEVSVGSGKVIEVAPQSTKVRIDNATGTLAKDQLLRIESAGETPPATATPPKATTSANSLIRGDWIGTMPDGSRISISFKDDDSLLWLVEESRSASYARAKYRVDSTTTPNRVELFDFTNGDLKGQTMSAAFEIQSDGRLKLDASVGANEHPERGFTSASVLFSRAPGPIVIPPNATLATPQPNDAAARSSIAPVASATPKSADDK